MPTTSPLTGTKTFVSLKPPDLSTCTKEELTAYFTNSYDLNESVFLGLKDDSVFYKCPDRLRLPLIFYYAHTACVYVNKLMLGGLIQERVDQNFETMFETGVDEMSWDDTEHFRMGESYQWPSVSEVVEYRRKVRNLILKVIEDTPLNLPIKMDDPLWALMMGMEHERIHLETSSVLIRQLPVDLVQRPEGWTYGPTKAGNPIGANAMIKTTTTEVTLGKPTDFPSYGWDNEYGEVTCKVPPFEASKYPVTNGEFLNFVEEGGYSTRDLWTEEGWKWVEFRQARHPTFWCCDQGCKSGCGSDLVEVTHCNVNFEQQNGGQNGSQNGEQNGGQNGSQNGEQNGGQNGNQNGHTHANGNGVAIKKRKCSQYKYRAVFDVLDMPWEWPVEVNYHEAKAFCKWKGPGYRLPVEAEHHVMRGKQLPASEGTISDIIFQKSIKSNLNLQYGSSTPVNLYGPSATGFHDVFGNVWEWVEDHFNGLTGFHTHFLYDDFSSPCFDGKHNVIMGGSWISTGDEASRFARYAFRRHFFQHSGFRLARSASETNGRGAVDLPARVVETEVFVLGSGVQANKLYLDNNFNVQRVKSTNEFYLYDSIETLEGILELEFGFRDGFAASVSRLCGRYAELYDVPMESAVQVGCATGRGALEMSKSFTNVLGIEMCGRLIDAAIKIQKESTVSLNDGTNVALDADYKLSSVVFKQLTWLPNEVESHDLVLITHLDRVQNVKAWLIRLWEITKPHGLLVVASKDGKWNQETLDTHLRDRLTCITDQEVPYEDRSGKKLATVTVWKYL